MEIKYFDHAATTQIKKEVIDEMHPFLDKEYGNPSSMHIKGQYAKEAIMTARKRVADSINADIDEIYFTSCGTEADNMAIKGFARANKKRGNHIITTKIEHKAILESCKVLEDEGFEITYLDVDKFGMVDIDGLKKSIQDNTILISIMFANNEVGTIQPIKEIGKIAQEHKIAFHTDAVQVVGNVEINVKDLNLNMLSMSAHKFYGPKGVGCLYVDKNITINGLINGGGQEKHQRAGTENVAGIVGLGKAIELANKNISEYNNKLYKLSSVFLKEIQKCDCRIQLNGHPTKRLRGNVNLTIFDIDAESLLLLLSERGFCISTASACSTNSKSISHVLKAIKLTEKQAKETIRITFGEENTEKDVIELANNIKEIVKKIKSMG